VVEPANANMLPATAQAHFWTVVEVAGVAVKPVAQSQVPAPALIEAPAMAEQAVVVIQMGRATVPELSWPDGQVQVPPELRTAPPEQGLEQASKPLMTLPVKPAAVLHAQTPAAVVIAPVSCVQTQALF